MAWSPPATLGSGSGTTSAASQSIAGITAAAGTLVVVGGSVRVVGSSATGVSVSDSAGNSYTVHYEANAAASWTGFAFVAFCVLTNALSGGTITVTRIGSANIDAFCMGAASWTGGSGAEDTAVLATANGTSNTPSVTGNAASQANDLLIAVCGYPLGSGSNYTEDTADGWTNLFDISTAGTVNTFGMAYQVNSGTAGIKHAPTITGSTKWAEVTFALAPAGGGSIALAGLGAAMASGRGSVSYSTALVARGVAQTQGRAGAGYSTALAARGVAQARGFAGAAYSTALTAKGAAQTFGRAGANFAASLAARATAMAKAGAGANYLAHLFGRGTAMAAGRASFAGNTVQLAARGLAAAFGRATPSFAAALAGRGAVMAWAALRFAGLVAPHFILAAPRSVRALAAPVSTRSLAAPRSLRILSAPRDAGG